MDVLAARYAMRAVLGWSITGRCITLRLETTVTHVILDAS